jgi:hypothetical protein
MKVQQEAVAELRCIRVLTPHEQHDLNEFVQWMWPGEQDHEVRRVLAGCCLHLCYVEATPQLHHLAALLERTPDEIAYELMETAHTASGPHALIYDAGHHLICTPSAEQNRWLAVLKMRCAHRMERSVDRKLMVGRPSEEATVLATSQHKK